MTTKIALLETLFLKTGIYISNKNDCKAVSELIQQEKLGYLSESTLYRLFLSKNNRHQPYPNTLNVLAIFCGFKSWNQFLSFTHRTYEDHDGRYFQQSLESVVRYFVANSKHTSLIDLFDSVAQLRYRQKEFIAVATFSGFLKKEDFPLLLKDFGFHPFVRLHIIEALYDPYRRIPGYTEAIEFYTQHQNPSTDTFYQDFIFGYTLLFRHAYLDRSEYVKNIGQHLFQQNQESTEFKALHLFPKTRYLAYLVWYLHLTEQQGAFHEHLLALQSWTEKTITSSFDYLEVNIVYQTLGEVYDELQLEAQNNLLQQVYQQYLLRQPAEERALIIHHHANGLLHFFPPCG
jgi:hypothetical protein